MDKQVRNDVFARAIGFCESPICGRSISTESGHLDHFFGRAKAEETIENCWALCVTCDNAKTGSKPDAMHWLRLFVRHLARHLQRGDFRYQAPLERTFTKMAVLLAKGFR